MGCRPASTARRAGGFLVAQRESGAPELTGGLALLCPRASPAAARPSTDMTDTALHQRMANAIRALAMDAVEKANSGHPGLPMGMADVATVLFTRYLKFDPSDPKWPDRDRF